MGVNKLHSNATVPDRVAAFIELARPGPVAGAAVATLIGGLAVEVALTAPIVLGVVVAALVTGAGNCINDYYDRDIDGVTHPDRPLQRGTLSPAFVRAVALSMFGVAVLLALSLPVYATAVVALDVVLLLAYTPYVKGTFGLGNVLVAGVASCFFVVGGSVVGSPLTGLTLFPVVFFPLLSREILLDVRDVPGDRNRGLHTLPIVLGRRRTVALAGRTVILGVLTVPVPYLFGPLGIGYLLACILAVVPLLWVVYRLWVHRTIDLGTLRLGIASVVLALLIGAIGPL